MEGAANEAWVTPTHIYEGLWLIDKQRWGAMDETPDEMYLQLQSLIDRVLKVISVKGYAHYKARTIDGLQDDT